jgi:hypothetical protein
MKDKMDYFFNWLSTPMDKNDVDLWFKAYNIQREYSELFRDFCFSLFYLMKDTYLGDSHGNIRETKIGMTKDDNKSHFIWCWLKTIENFSKENIIFNFSNDDFDYFEDFFFEVYYDQSDENVKESIETFLEQLFTWDRVYTKSDLEMYTDLYKVMERSLEN